VHVLLTTAGTFEAQPHDPVYGKLSE